MAAWSKITYCSRIADLKEGECATDMLLKESMHLINRDGEFDEFGGGERVI